MLNNEIPVLGFAGFSGTGKTTLLQKVIPLLKSQGLNTGLIKHSHHNFDIDHPGKDSFLLREGASPVMLVSRYRRAIVTEFTNNEEPKLSDQLKHLDQSGLDLILVEGFKRESFPKIELHRPVIGKPLLFPDDPSVIAIATDTHLPVAVVDIPVLDINQAELIVNFIIEDFLGQSRKLSKNTEPTV